MPNLLEVQKASYDQFLMVDAPNGGRPDAGLQGGCECVHLDFVYNDVVHATIDRPRKIPATSLLITIGMDAEEILSTFYNKIIYNSAGDHCRIPFIFFHYPAPTEIYTLSLHDALPI